MVVMALMAVAVGMALLLPMDQHPHMGPGNALAGDGLRRHRYAGQQAVHIPQETLLLLAQLIERAHEHIARRAHGAFHI